MSIIDLLPQIQATRVGSTSDKPCGMHDGDARLTLKLGDHLLVADCHGGAIHSGMLRCSIYLLRDDPYHSSPFTNLQRLLVKLPEFT